MLHPTHLRLVIPEHARQRARERGVDLAEVVRTVRRLAESDRLGPSGRGIFALRGDDADGPTAVVKLTAARVAAGQDHPGSRRPPATGHADPGLRQAAGRTVSA